MANIKSVNGIAEASLRSINGLAKANVKSVNGLTIPGGTPWTPASLSELAAWYDALDSGTITYNGSNYVSQWDDKSGSGYHMTQSNAAYKPLYDSGDDSINFTEDYMEYISGISAQAGFAVIRNADGNIGLATVTMIFGDGGSGSYIFLRTNSSDYTISVDGALLNTGDITINGGDLTPGDGTGTNITYSGFSGFPTHNEADSFYFQIDQAENFTKMATYRNPPRDPDASNVDIHEWFLFTNSLSTSDRQKLEGYCAHKWGIESKLPAGHPYKSSPPTI